ncbi:MAG: glycolate oxidase subunit GlcE [Gammaproteobacteria bacterium]|nr:glycolate oxidase subunit GlcE [Gammaproteobacteria bacterium]
MADADLSQALRTRLLHAAAARRPLVIRGSGSKDFLGQPSAGEPLEVGGHRGVMRYAPEELVLTARAGTPLTEIEALLAQHGQMLAFEPPHFGAAATLGGTVACGLSGPRRAAAGACRDFVLGVQIIDGRGRVLRFGGEVIKNVAGYDLSRLMAGAFGTLGVLLQISLKVLPAPRCERTLAFESDLAGALARLAEWARRPLPLSASAWVNGRLWLRLSGAQAAVAAAARELGGETVDGEQEPWSALREHRHPFFARSRPLWRLSLPPALPSPKLAGGWLLEWHGAQRWLDSDEPAPAVRAAAAAAGGHATLFRRNGAAAAIPVFAPLPPPLLALHRRLKTVLDPCGILNPGRLYAEF